VSFSPSNGFCQSICLRLVFLDTEGLIFKKTIKSIILIFILFHCHYFLTVSMWQTGTGFYITHPSLCMCVCVCPGGGGGKQALAFTPHTHKYVLVCMANRDWLLYHTHTHKYAHACIANRDWLLYHTHTHTHTSAHTCACQVKLFLCMK
jgi:hypothetical protein